MSSPYLNSFLLSAILSSAVLLESKAIGQLPDRIEERSIVYAQSELENVRAEFETRLADVEASGWLKSDQSKVKPLTQLQWEALPYVAADLPASVFASLQTAVAERSAEQRTILRNYYLSEINSATRSKLSAVYRRVNWLSRYVAAAKTGGYSQSEHLADLRCFHRQRLIEPYWLYTQDPENIRPKAVEYLRKMADYLAGEIKSAGEFQDFGWQCVKDGSIDPIVNLHVIGRISEGKKDLSHDAAWKMLTEASQRISTVDYSSQLKLLAAISRILLIKSKKLTIVQFSPEEIDAFESEYHDLTVAALRDASHCPEEVRALDHLLKNVTVATMVPEVRQLEFLKRVEGDEEISSWLKSRYGQLVYQGLAEVYGRKEDQSQQFFKAAMRHGKAAMEALPLAPEPVLTMMASSLNLQDRREAKRLMAEALRRQPDWWPVYLLHLQWGQSRVTGSVNSAVELVDSISRSNRYDLGIPDLVLTALDETRKYGDYEAICSNPKTFDAIERVIQGGQKNGRSEKWSLEFRKVLVLAATRSLQIDKAIPLRRQLDKDLALAKELSKNAPKPASGAVWVLNGKPIGEPSQTALEKYRDEELRMMGGRQLTLARMAVMGCKYIHDLEQRIEVGDFELSKVQSTIDELELERMELDAEASVYVDELIALLRAIESFEAGEWTELTTKNENLIFWRNDANNAFRAFSEGVETSESLSMVMWRWPMKGPYVVEADIENLEFEKNPEYRSHGFAIREWYQPGGFGPAFRYLFLNPGGPFIGADSKNFARWAGLKKSGTNRARARVWPDYCEFCVNNERVLHDVNSFQVRTNLTLKSNSNSRTQFSKVRVRKLPDHSPIGERSQSISYWDQRLALEPDSADLYLDRANTIFRLGKSERFDDAIRDCQAATKLAEHGKTTGMALVNSLAHAGRWKEARQEAELLFKKYPDSASVETQLAALLVVAKDEAVRNGKQSAVHSNRLSKIVSPEKFKRLQLKAAGEARLGEFEKAVMTLDGAMKINPDDRFVRQVQDAYRQKKWFDYDLQYFSEPWSPLITYEASRSKPAVSDGLVKMWTFDTDFKESLENGIGKPLGNPRIVEGKVRGALLIGDGKGGNRLDALETNPVNLEKAFSFTFWVFRVNDDGSIMSLSDGSGFNGLFFDIQENLLLIRMERNGAESSGNFYRGPIFPKNRWTHVALTFDGKSPTGYSWYVDGSKVGDLNVSHNPGQRWNLPADTTQFRFGNSNSRTFGFAGMLDEVRVYNRAITPEEIKAIRDDFAEN